MKIAMISRAARFSPNSVKRDAAIIEQTTTELTTLGHAVECLDEESLTEDCLKPFDIILSMGRDERTLQLLLQREKEGTRVLNSALALKQLSRRRIIEACSAEGICTPPHSFDHPLAFPFWWKRDDQCAVTSEDVVMVKNEADWLRVQQKGIGKYVIEAHIPGDIVKFYGVCGTDFFHVSRPTYSKFGNEAENGETHNFAFDKMALRKSVDTLARATGIHIYGGDAIVDETGATYIIDFNDWPSFAACTEQAAKAIAQLIHA